MSGAFVQASVVAIDGRGVLLWGEAGVGKSDLALRLIDGGASLIGDDGVRIAEQSGRLVATALTEEPPRLHVAGIGIVRAARHAASVPLSLAVRCTIDGPADRLAQLGLWRHGALALPEIALAARESSAPVKLRLALARWGL